MFKIEKVKCKLCPAIVNLGKDFTIHIIEKHPEVWEKKMVEHPECSLINELYKLYKQYNTIIECLKCGYDGIGIVKWIRMTDGWIKHVSCPECEGDISASELTDEQYAEERLRE